ncbi:conjugal transfer protein TraD [Sphingomonas hengshuiensis]|uniref:Conjugal transfer protein TraD n=1 Tax=Sphingomonas hengshuiensis TaxID=1609977 RepID=A0A7U5CUK2_9SPHN|nr:conjugal transfer protein TraD [Sphingomonas hengshuiensis]AJP70579.1 hypothetical protein TS85_00120 [Sphingomonas hengshuiensis]
MRKPRDYDSELHALNDKAKLLKERKVQQLGEVVAATGADALPIELLAGALLSAVDCNDAAAKEGWRKRGAAFFQGAHKSGGVARGDARSDPAGDGRTSSVASQDRA